MKKLTYILCAMVVALASFTMTGCGLADNALQSSVEEFNKTCPQDLSDGIVLTKAVLEETSLVFDCSVDPEQIPFEAIKEAKDTMKEAMTKSLKTSYSSNEDTKTLVDLVVTAGKSIKFRFNDGTGNSEEVEVSKDELAVF